MVLSRMIGGLGRAMITTGALVLLFVVYQLWGTGVRTGAAQNELRDSFRSRQAELARQAPATGSASTTTTTTTTRKTPGAPSTTASPTTPVTAAPTPPPKAGEAIGQIRIPRIGVDFTIVEGVDLGNLARGPGHFPSTPLPGQAGNAAVAGHRVTHSAPFNRIDELMPGDKIEVETFQGTFTYQVVPGGNVNPSSSVGYRIITPDQTEILDQVPGQNTITLMACHPKYDLKQRIVVVGRLVEAPAPSTPRTTVPPGQPLPAEPAVADVGTDLVGGDSGAVGPALLYSLCAALVWLAAWVVARRWPSWRSWPRWAVFAAAVPVFAVPVFLAFEQINQLLPAGY